MSTDLADEEGILPDGSMQRSGNVQLSASSVQSSFMAFAPDHAGSIKSVAFLRGFEEI